VRRRRHATSRRASWPRAASAPTGPWGITLPTAQRRGASCWASTARRMRGDPGCTADHAPLPQRGPLTGWRIASVLLRAQVEAGAHAKDWLASPGEDEPHWSLIDTADLASRAPASSMCAPAPRADRPACTGAPPWVPLGPLCGLWPAEPASPSASTGEVSLAVDWAALARRTFTMTEATPAQRPAARRCCWCAQRVAPGRGRRVQCRHTSGTASRIT